ncbi:hypothetical protein [Natrialbaceae archaeon AArc-T1-2]|uniref:hypothetical protein n=1 Tax=Natrialbaceae archaeon AArc-T1-2 TaxID=3053904 RepID=UPI00255A7185|nr:hypothetical protein [Natrialbaceae archaeon AArc-T1-2]WIV68526.1 hypothetical protein QQ977_07335 [Natrialbaceae archaeon AArc-T1-2]
MNGRDDVDPASDIPNGRFQLAVGLYVGVFLAGIATTALAPTDPSPSVLAGTSVIGGLVGVVLGIGVARVDHELSARLGRTVARRRAVAAPAGLFGAIAIASWIVSVGARVVTASVTAAIALLVTGSVLGTLAGNRYVDRVVTDEPIATWDWEPPGAPRLDGVLFLAWTVMAVTAAVAGNWLTAAIWTTIGVLWLVSCLVEGRWRFASVGASPEVRVHEAGLVKRRPYSRSFVPWKAVDHVRVREDELVIDRGLRDVRFDRTELGDLEAVLETIERQRPDEGPPVLG